MENNCFKDKNHQYYNMFKAAIACLIPEGSNVILDVGCGTGVFGRKLKSQNKASEVVGVEIFQEAADEAAKYYEKIHHGDVEHMDLDYRGYFDFVICSDIIEHLVDPWKMLLKVNTWLKSEGHVLVSIPNVRYWRVLRNLVFLGEWEYLERGILDETHLRFFTRKSLLGALGHAGFKVVQCRFDVGGTRQKLFNTATFHIFEEFMGAQIFVDGRKRR